jgi:hypothetical protein
MRWLRGHGVLLAVYGGGLLLAAFELTNPGVRPELEDARAYLEAGSNVADVSAALYPDRALTLYYQAYQASLCAGRAGDPDSVCGRRGSPRPGEVRELLERSLATGNQSIELALYNYVLVLLDENAPEAEVEAAIRSWRLAHPSSAYPDPRSVYQEHRRAAGRLP